MSLQDLLQQHTQHYPAGSPTLEKNSINDLLAYVDNWELAGGNAITRTYKFNNYNETIEFVNKAAKIIQQQDHHPEMVIGYNTCRLTFSTHTVDGLTLNDFICAAKIDAIV